MQMGFSQECHGVDWGLGQKELGHQISYRISIFWNEKGFS
jgi:hypothetical protein